MAENDRMTNERYHEWMAFFDKMQEDNKLKKEREELNHVLKNGTIIDRCLIDYDPELDCVKSNASEEVIVQYENTIYYLYVENDTCDGRIVLCQHKKSVSGDEDKCGACGCTPCDCGWGS